MTQSVEPVTPPTGATPPATQPPPPPNTGPPPAADPAADAMTTDAGKKALAELRQANKALEQKLASLAPLADLAAAIGVKPEQGKTDVQTLTDQVAELKRQAADERVGRMRAEVAARPGKLLPPELAEVLRGQTREELEAHADRLLAVIPQGSATPGTPAPDPTQGARGGVDELQAALAAARTKGDIKEQVRLKVLINQQRK